MPADPLLPGDALRLARERSGHTMGDLARFLGVDVTLVSAIERGAVGRLRAYLDEHRGELATLDGLRAALVERNTPPEVAVDPALARHAVVFEYVNHAGVDSTRRVVLTAKSLRFEAAPPYYPEPEWLVDGFDLDRGAQRTFALCKMRDVRRA